MEDYIFEIVEDETVDVPQTQGTEEDEFLSLNHLPESDDISCPILVIGVGGAGGNAVQHLAKKREKGISFLLCNTDSQDLAKVSVPHKIQLGLDPNGNGAGNVPETAEMKAKESYNEVKNFIEERKAQGLKVVFITAGLGGGTGSGASYIIAKICKEECDLLTISIASIPHRALGRTKSLKALTWGEKLKESSNAISLINNDKIFSNLPEGATTEYGYEKADEVLGQAVNTIADLINKTGNINVDFNDIYTTLSEGGYSLISSAVADGTNKEEVALDKAFNQELLTNIRTYGCSKFLFAITTSPQHKMEALKKEALLRLVSKKTGNSDIIDGEYIDPTLGEFVKISIIAAGLPPNFLKQTEEEITQKILTEEERKEKQEKDKLLQEAYQIDSFEEEAIPYLFNIHDLENATIIKSIDLTPAVKRTDTDIQRKIKQSNKTAISISPFESDIKSSNVDVEAIMPEQEEDESFSVL